LESILGTDFSPELDILREDTEGMSVQVWGGREVRTLVVNALDITEGVAKVSSAPFIAVT
jgi:hypothetical protein